MSSSLKEVDWQVQDIDKKTGKGKSDWTDKQFGPEKSEELRLSRILSSGTVIEYSLTLDDREYSDYDDSEGYESIAEFDKNNSITIELDNFSSTHSKYLSPRNNSNNSNNSYSSTSNIKNNKSNNIIKNKSSNNSKNNNNFKLDKNKLVIKLLGVNSNYSYIDKNMNNLTPNSQNVSNVEINEWDCNKVSEYIGKIFQNKKDEKMILHYKNLCIENEMNGTKLATFTRSQWKSFGIIDRNDVTVILTNVRKTKTQTPIPV